MEDSQAEGGEDSRQQVQKKTFGKWINFQLAAGGRSARGRPARQVTDLYYDLRDGHILLDVLQVLTGVFSVSLV